MEITPRHTRKKLAYPVRAIAVAAAAAALSSCDRQQVVGIQPDHEQNPAKRHQNIRGKYLIEEHPATPTNPAPEKPAPTAPSTQVPPQTLRGEPPATPENPDNRAGQAIVGLYVSDTPENKDTPPSSQPAPKEAPEELPGDVPAPTKE